MFGLLSTMLEYYLPGLDASRMSDDEFCSKLGHLLHIRQAERNESKKL